MGASGWARGGRWRVSTTRGRGWRCGRPWQGPGPGRSRRRAGGALDAGLAPRGGAEAGLAGIERTASVASDNASTTAVESGPRRRPDRALDEVEDAVARVRSDLPRTVSEPIARRLGVTGPPVLTCAASDLMRSIEGLSWHGDDSVAHALQTVEGVGKIERRGPRDPREPGPRPAGRARPRPARRPRHAGEPARDHLRRLDRALGIGGRDRARRALRHRRRPDRRRVRGPAVSIRHARLAPAARRHARHGRGEEMWLRGACLPGASRPATLGRDAWPRAPRSIRPRRGRGPRRGARWPRRR